MRSDRIRRSLWLICAISAVVALIAAAAQAVWASKAEETEAANARLLAQLKQQESSRKVAGEAVPPEAAPGFEALLAHAQTAAAAASGSITSASTSVSLLDDKGTSRQQALMTVHGDYSAQKLVLAHLLDRFPIVGLQRWSVKRAGGPRELEGQIELVWLDQGRAP